MTDCGARISCSLQATTVDFPHGFWRLLSAVTSPPAMAILGTENPASLCAGFLICPPRR